MKANGMVVSLSEAELDGRLGLVDTQLAEISEQIKGAWVEEFRSNKEMSGCLARAASNERQIAARIELLGKNQKEVDECIAQRDIAKENAQIRGKSFVLFDWDRGQDGQKLARTLDERSKLKIALLQLKESLLRENQQQQEVMKRLSAQVGAPAALPEAPKQVQPLEGGADRRQASESVIGRFGSRLRKWMNFIPTVFVGITTANWVMQRFSRDASIPFVASLVFFVGSLIRRVGSSKKSQELAVQSEANAGAGGSTSKVVPRTKSTAVQPLVGETTKHRDALARSRQDQRGLGAQAALG